MQSSMYDTLRTPRAGGGGSSGAGMVSFSSSVYDPQEGATTPTSPRSVKARISRNSRNSRNSRESRDLEFGLLALGSPDPSSLIGPSSPRQKGRRASMTDGPDFGGTSRYLAKVVSHEAASPLKQNASDADLLFEDGEGGEVTTHEIDDEMDRSNVAIDQSRRLSAALSQLMSGKAMSPNSMQKVGELSHEVFRGASCTGTLPTTKESTSMSDADQAAVQRKGSSSGAKGRARESSPRADRTAAASARTVSTAATSKSTSRRRGWKASTNRAVLKAAAASGSSQRSTFF